ncbi:uncharacterized protein CANTADRAFT_6216 [Suhomyces tanzawaensis NRRL Y-17324]|uniref:Cation efflux protein n=1 Tax=Suhomyces tanzawaensis NRRL Y-17324 TaxID=984487 RepID=A0A1E4SHQ5_9ASCO|nr:uncharacterized protein CANTADRAFT_6216 [Suhomyces tanzawaensis NRRL Y-17324]ODV79026.1 hypothetical protein CANTADRAFT_6216 [Suhomyces tanzawaensis NRRL Y-17324]
MASERDERDEYRARAERQLNSATPTLMDSPIPPVRTPNGVHRHSYQGIPDSLLDKAAEELSNITSWQVPAVNASFAATGDIHEQRTQRPADIRKLSSANFSSDSLVDPNPAPLTPTINSVGGSYSPATNTRRYSNSSRPRPKSAVFMMDSNFAISEDGSPIQSPISNTPRSRNSVHFGQRNSYIPNTTFPPTGPVAMPPRSSSPTRSTSPSRQSRNYRSKSPVRRLSSPSKTYLPFNFQPQEMMLQNNNSNQSLLLKPAHRKGHKYKHSSVSMNLFQEPPPSLATDNQLLKIPSLYPIPNFKESLASITPAQKLKVSWSFIHLSLSLIVFLIGLRYKLSALSTLAHLIFYDSIGSIVIVFVDIMSNFEVWNNSSITYPFGLGRLEVLVGFALSASLVMVGFDLVSHFVEEFIIELVVDPDAAAHGEQHNSHHIHGDGGGITNWFTYELVLIVTMVVTLITSNYILAYEKINEMISSQEEKSFITEKSREKSGILGDTVKNTSAPQSVISDLKKYVDVWTKNPTHFLTLSYSTFLMIIPVIPLSFDSETVDLNEMASLIVALLLCYTGWRLVKSLGGILLCSYPHSDYDYHKLKCSIMDQILSMDFFKHTYTVEKFFITKFNYQLFVVGLQINMKGASNDDESRLRFEIARIVKREIEKIDTHKNTKIENTIDINRI